MTNCMACDRPIEKRKTEQHHFPVPKRNGGTLTIPLCRLCHDFVDRIPLEDWPFDWWVEAWAGMPREARLLMLKVLSMATDHVDLRNAKDLGAESVRRVLAMA